MQTYSQTFPAASTWEINTPGRYFILMACTLACNVRFFSGGKRLDFGEIKTVLAGLEVGGRNEGVEFDRVQIDVQAGDNVTVGIGNGQVHYNRSNGTVDVNTQAPVRAGAPTQTAPLVNTVSGAFISANANRKYLLIQNKNAQNRIWINLAGSAATQAGGIVIPPGGYFSQDCGSVTTAAISAIGEVGANADVVVVEG